MSPHEIAESYELTSSISRAISLRKRMQAISESIDRLESEFFARPDSQASDKLRRARLEAFQIGHALLGLYDEIDEINWRRGPGREAEGCARRCSSLS